jgi:hypothetical protein
MQSNQASTPVGSVTGSEIHMQSELHGPVVHRCADDTAEVSVGGIRNGLAELRMIQQIEEIRAKAQSSLVTARKLEILLK